MSLKIIYVNAPARTGKDEFCNLCRQFIPCMTTSTIDYIKTVAKESFKWDGIKDEKGRKLLASLRYAAGEYNDLPISIIGNTIDTARKAGFEVLFIHVREHSEMMKMLDLYGGETLTVLRDVEIGEVEQKFIDERPDDFVFDHIINNFKSLDYLVARAKEWCGENN